MKLPGAVCGGSAECASASCITGLCQCSSACAFSFACAQGCSLPSACIYNPAGADYCGAKKAHGETCFRKDDCLSGLCTFNANGGLCTLKTSGASCTNNSECASDRCYAGLCECSTTCVYDPASCAQGCSLPSACIFNPAGADYCGAKKARGETCSRNDDCLSGACTFNANAGLCTLKTSGDSCTNNSECASDSCYAGLCECSTTCVYDPASCAQGCSLPSACIYNRIGADYCGAKKAHGETCSRNNDCLSGSCSQELKCTSIPGATCASLSEWSSNSCVAGIFERSSSCICNPTSYTQGCSLPSTCMVLPAPFASYCSEK